MQDMSRGRGSILGGLKKHKNAYCLMRARFIMVQHTEPRAQGGGNDGFKLTACAKLARQNLLDGLKKLVHLGRWQAEGAGA